MGFDDDVLQACRAVIESSGETVFATVDDRDLCGRAAPRTRNGYCFGIGPESAIGFIICHSFAPLVAEDIANALVEEGDSLDTVTAADRLVGPEVWTDQVSDVALSQPWNTAQYVNPLRRRRRCVLGGPRRRGLDLASERMFLEYVFARLIQAA